MKHIAIVGAGQAGLQLGISLLKKGHNTTLLSNRTPENLLNGKIMSSQGMFSTALNYEKELGLNFWDDICPKNQSIQFSIVHHGQKILTWKGLTHRPFQAIDQRLKFSRWLKEFQWLGGNVLYQEADLLLLEELSKSHDLVIIAGGKANISDLFKRDTTKSAFDKPPRELGCFYVNGVLPISNNPGLRANILPGIGEFFIMPGLTLSGSCNMLLFEGIPGKEFDCWKPSFSKEQILEKIKSLLGTHIPWEAENCRSITLTDDNATLMGRYTPIVRHPFFNLPSGKPILGMADTVVLNDPIAGQGANNASKCAKIYLDSILQNSDNNFDEIWMQNTFNQYWEYAKWSTEWTNILLKPLEPHIVELLSAAKDSQLLANKLASSFDDLTELFPWIQNSDTTHKIIRFFKETPSVLQNTNNDGAHSPHFSEILHKINTDETNRPNI